MVMFRVIYARQLTQAATGLMRNFHRPAHIWFLETPWLELLLALGRILWQIDSLKSDEPELPKSGGSQRQE